MISLSINRSAMADGLVASKSAAQRATSRVANQQVINNQTPLLLRAWQWFSAKREARVASKQLSVTETVSLGEKRFVSLVTVGGRQFLVGGGPGNVSLLADLGAEPKTAKAKDANITFQKALKKSQLAATSVTTISKPRKASLPKPAAASHKVLPAVAAKVLAAPSIQRSSFAASRKRNPAKTFINGGLA